MGKVFSGKNSPTYKHGLRNKGSKCKICKAVIYYKAIYCIKCNGKMHSIRMSKENNSNFKEGKYCNNKCVDCNIKIKQQRKRCKKCDLIWRKIKLLGKSNPNWKGGLGRIPYTFDFYRIRLQILKRDNYICQHCGKRGTHVHHIDYDKQNNLPINLITTCNRCNSCANGNRDYWYAYYTYILKEE